jgi:hypothetical protein
VRWGRFSTAAMLAALAACSRSDDRNGRSGAAAPVTPPAQLCRTRKPLAPCRTVADVEGWLARADLEILGAAPTPSGIQGARVLTLRVPGPAVAVFRAKWRAHSTTTSRNSPRRELASYAVQKLFLEPHEYTVPPAAPHCFPLQAYRAQVDAKADSTYRGTDCVYGILSYWVEDLMSLSDARSAGWFDGADKHAFDRKLFDENRTYKDSIAAVNLFTYLIAHADSHARNFAITREPSSPFVYSVDNSLSLGASRNKKLGPEHDWSRLRVPALPRTLIDRLRGPNVEAGLESLRVVAELTPRDRLLVVTARRGDPAPNRTGMDWDGNHLRVGLTEAEIGGVRARIKGLLGRVDRGELRLY